MEYLSSVGVALGPRKSGRSPGAIAIGACSVAAGDPHLAQVSGDSRGRLSLSASVVQESSACARLSLSINSASVHTGARGATQT